ncbi:hypothetical protein C0989_002375 [Termitomyces sp. Mn162]|nr:hypothetical protein C0989_002375 [Termitomyces sp. Mn162]
MSKLNDLKRMALAIAFILDADISDHVSDILAEAVASKVLGCLEGTTDILSSTASFLVANDANHAGLTLDLKAATDKLVGVMASLEAHLPSSMCSPPPPATDTPITWASIAKAACKTTQPAILIQCNSNDPLIQKASTALLQDNLNKLLKQLDEKSTVAWETEEGEIEALTPCTHAIGLRAISRSAYLAEFESAESVSRFRHHANMEWHLFDIVFSESIEVVNKSYNLIASAATAKSMAISAGTAKRSATVHTALDLTTPQTHVAQQPPSVYHAGQPRPTQALTTVAQSLQNAAQTSTLVSWRIKCHIS